MGKINGRYYKRQAQRKAQKNTDAAEQQRQDNLSSQDKFYELAGQYNEMLDNSGSDSERIRQIDLSDFSEKDYVEGVTQLQDNIDRMSKGRNPQDIGRAGSDVLDLSDEEFMKMNGE